jgi:hypothetical protein
MWYSYRHRYLINLDINPGLLLADVGLLFNVDLAGSSRILAACFLRIGILAIETKVPAFYSFNSLRNNFLL